MERSSQYDVSKAVADAPRCGVGGSRWVGGDLLLGIHDGGCVLCVIMVWMVKSISETGGAMWCCLVAEEMVWMSIAPGVFELTTSDVSASHVMGLSSLLMRLQKMRH